MRSEYRETLMLDRNERRGGPEWDFDFKNLNAFVDGENLQTLGCSGLLRGAQAPRNRGGQCRISVPWGEGVRFRLGPIGAIGLV